jgi:energy-coupling factor transporter ATP-binding protein EcfA2
MPKAYVSSTFDDLQEHRQAVSRTLRRAGFEDVAMEYYVAEDQRAIDRCLADVERCDLYVGVFAWRYGWNPPKSQNPERISITEIEYRHALKLGKPRLLFLSDPKAPWPPLYIDKSRKMMRLRNDISTDRLAGLFSTPDSLVGVLAPALQQLNDRVATAPGMDAESYFRYLRNRYATLDLDALMDPKHDELLPLRLETVFVEQHVKEDPPPIELPKEAWDLLRNRRDVHADELPPGITPDVLAEVQQTYLAKPSRPALEVVGTDENRCSIILGNPGSGKSTLLRYLLLSLTDPAAESRLPAALAGRLPVLIELKSYVALRARRECRNFWEYLDRLHESEACPAAGTTIKAYLDEQHPAVILFDGIDEIFDPDEQEKISRQIVAVAEAYPAARVIASSRVIGYRRKLLTDAGFKHLTLQDFTPEQVTVFARQWYQLVSRNPAEVEERVARIARGCSESASILQLAGNPMLLTIMAIIGKHEELPRARWELYEHAASVLVQHWDVKKHLSSRVDLLGDHDKKELLRRLAYAMQSGEGGLAGNYIHSEELALMFETYLEERYPRLPAADAVKTARAIIAEFRERNFILASYGANLFGFVHRAFLEFFCASAIVRKFEKTREIGIEELKALFEVHRAEKAWQEVLRLVCGQIAESFAAQVLDALSATGDTDGIRIALECATEIRHIESIADTINRIGIAALSTLSADLPSDDDICTLFVDRIQKLADRWPNRDAVLPWLESHLAEAGNSLYTGTAAGSIVSGSAPAKEFLLRSLSSTGGQSYRKNAAAMALCAGWKSDETVQRLLALISETGDRAPLGAIWGLGRYFDTDDGVRDMLYSFATHASYQGRIARLAIKSFLPEQVRSIPVLLQLLSEPEDHDVSEIIRLLEFHINEPRVRQQLQDVTGREDIGALASEILDRHPA